MTVETVRGFCDSCRFNDRQPVVMPDGKPIIGKEQLICRRFPPTVVALQIPSPGGMSVQMLPVFPGVSDDVWCFEYQPENGAQDVLN